MSPKQRTGAVMNFCNLTFAYMYLPGVAFPQQHLLTAPEVFGPGGVPNLQLLRDHFLGEGRLDNDCLLKIVTEASRVMAKENNVVYVNGLVKG